MKNKKINLTEISFIKVKNFCLSICTPEDAWLKKSTLMMEQKDQDYIPSSDTEESEIENESYDLAADRVFFVYESQLNKLLKVCQACHQPIIHSRSLEQQGTQHVVKMECIGGCITYWNTQPKTSKLKGI